MYAIRSYYVFKVVAVGGIKPELTYFRQIVRLHPDYNLPVFEAENGQIMRYQLYSPAVAARTQCEGVGPSIIAFFNTEFPGRGIQEKGVVFPGYKKIT